MKCIILIAVETIGALAETVFERFSPKISLIHIPELCEFLPLAKINTDLINLAHSSILIIVSKTCGFIC